MSFFGLGKKDRVIDLTEKYKRDQEEIENRKNEASSENNVSSGFGFLGGLANIGKSQEQDGYTELSASSDEKKKRLASRLMDMTNKLEDLSNQIYHLQQRVELLERKNRL